MQSISTRANTWTNPATVLPNLFAHTASPLKFLLFLGIARELLENPGSTIVSYETAAAHMVALSWCATHDNSVSFGDADPSQTLASRLIPKTAGPVSPETVKAAFECALKEVRKDTQTCDSVLRYAKYRLIRPFFKEETAGLESDLNSLLVRLSQSKFDEIAPLYQLDEANRLFVIHPRWARYITENADEVVAIVTDRFVRWLSIFNTVQIAKERLFPPIFVTQNSTSKQQLLSRLNEAASATSSKAPSESPSLTASELISFSAMVPTRDSLLARTIDAIREYVDRNDCSLEEAIAAHAINSKGLAAKESLLSEALVLILSSMPVGDRGISTAPPPGATQSNSSTPAAVQPEPVVQNRPASLTKPESKVEKPVKAVESAKGANRTPAISNAKLSALVQFLISLLQTRQGQSHYTSLRDHIQSTSLTKVTFHCPITGKQMDWQTALRESLRQMTEEQLVIAIANPERFRLTQKGWKFGEPERHSSTKSAPPPAQTVKKSNHSGGRGRDRAEEDNYKEIFLKLLSD